MSSTVQMMPCQSSDFTCHGVEAPHKPSQISYSLQWEESVSPTIIHTDFRGCLLNFQDFFPSPTVFSGILVMWMLAYIPLASWLFELNEQNLNCLWSLQNKVYLSNTVVTGVILIWHFISNHNSRLHSNNKQNDLEYSRYWGSKTLTRFGLSRLWNIMCRLKK